MCTESSTQTMHPLYIFDIDYESYLYDNHYDENSTTNLKLRNEFEYLFFLLNKNENAILKTSTLFDQSYLNKLTSLGFIIPKFEYNIIITQNHHSFSYIYFWGCRQNKHVEMILNSKLTSANIGLQYKWGFQNGKIISTIEDIQRHINNPCYTDIDCWILKRPHGFSGRGNKYIWKSKFDVNVINNLLELSKQSINNNFIQHCNNFYTKTNMTTSNTANNDDFSHLSIPISMTGNNGILLLEPVYKRLFDIGTTFEFDEKGVFQRQFMVENYISPSDSFQGGCGAKSIELFKKYIQKKYNYCLNELEVTTQEIKDIYIRLGLSLGLETIYNIQIDSFVYIDPSSISCSSQNSLDFNTISNNNKTTNNNNSSNMNNSNTTTTTTDNNKFLPMQSYKLKLYPLVEVNYRKTMGLVIQSLADQFCCQVSSSQNQTYNSTLMSTINKSNHDNNSYKSTINNTLHSNTSNDETNDEYIDIIDWRLVKTNSSDDYEGNGYILLSPPNISKSLSTLSSYFKIIKFKC